MMQFKTQGVCSQGILFDVKDDKIVSCNFVGGCPGNTMGVGKLVIGRPVDEVIATLEGITCGRKSTSCPDQLAKALRAYKAAQQ